MKKFISFMMAAFMLVISAQPISVNVYADTGDTDIGWENTDVDNGDGTYQNGNFTYRINDDGTSTVTAYSGNDTDLIIPGSFNGHIVTAIGAKAFRDKPTLVTVTVPLTVKTLEDYNFEACENLTEVRGIDNVEIIGNSCFNYSKKLSYIPKLTNLVTIEEYAFDSCICLKEFFIAKTVKNFSPHTFSESSVKFTMDEENPYYTLIDDVIYNKAVDTLIRGSLSIMECSIPDTVNTIGQYAFWYCSKLQKLYGGKNVKTVKSDAFAFCYKLESIADLSSLEEIQGDAFLLSVTTEVDLPRTVKTLKREAFFRCRMKKLIVHDNISVIPTRCFERCDRLEHVILDDGVKVISDGAFENCNNLKRVELPDTLEKIKSAAFACDLQEIYIPASVTAIERNAVGYTVSEGWHYHLNPDFKIYGHSGTAAEEYAKSNNIAFYDVDSLFDLHSLGASLRLTTAGIRFGFEINAEDSIPDDAEIGFLYCYGNNSEDMTLEQAGENGVIKKAAVNKVVNNGSTVFNLIFINMPEDAYTSDVTVRAYVKYRGLEYYSSQVTRNARQVALMMCEDKTNDEQIIKKVKEIYSV